MRFELLGSLRVLDGGCDVTPARPKQRALLALLVLRRGEVVAGAQLIEALWGEDPPGSAQNALHGHVSALRKLLGAERIRTRPPGYLLSAAADEVDVARFESLVERARARGDPGDRSAGLRDALALWRGEPLADLRGEPFAEREIARLEELRLAALEDRIDADLAGGRHFELVAELETVVAEHVFRERLRGQLMLALYRCGRQADALHAFQSGRRTLVEQLRPGAGAGATAARAADPPARPKPRADRTGAPGRAGPLRPQRRPEHRVSGDGRRPARRRAHLRLPLTPGEGLGGARPCPLPRTARLGRPPDPVRQARHRALRPAAPACRTSRPGWTTCAQSWMRFRAARAVLFGYSERRADGDSVRGDLPGADARPRPLRGLREAARSRRRLPVGTDARGARGLHRASGARLGLRVGHEDDVPVRRRRAGALVGRALPGRRQPRRHPGPQRDELADRRARLAAGDPRADARRPPRHRLRRQGRGRPRISRSGSAAPASSSFPAPTTSSESTRIRSSTSSSRSSRNAAPPRRLRPTIACS